MRAQNWDSVIKRYALVLRLSEITNPASSAIAAILHTITAPVGKSNITDSKIPIRYDVPPTR